MNNFEIVLSIVIIVIDTDRDHDCYINYHQKCFTAMVIVSYQEKVDRCMDGWNDGQMDDQ